MRASRLPGREGDEHIAQPAQAYGGIGRHSRSFSRRRMAALVAIAEARRRIAPKRRKSRRKTCAIALRPLGARARRRIIASAKGGA